MNTMKVNIGLLGALCVWLMASAAFVTTFVTNGNTVGAMDVVAYLIVSVGCVVLTDPR